MSKFGNAHGPKNKITAGCFDSTQRRLISAGSDGTVKMWNFSNGQCLTELLSNVSGKRIDTEVTELCCVYDPEDEEQAKMSYIISVGWDRKIHVWADEKDEEVETNKILPQ
jgi:WD40 repeat protein